ncbi:hypothetical protein QAD02_020961 [Eretmocerus hayati]|uniref:Uncharacterized protein n=1 Tax=Eretmocerus hayati TaxID=131215 RepID=A0ACC2PQ77_9HYME|nr:hypothetical protein QAD02_020961 [Eretmocerus hayati]
MSDSGKSDNQNASNAAGNGETVERNATTASGAGRGRGGRGRGRPRKLTMPTSDRRATRSNPSLTDEPENDDRNNPERMPSGPADNSGGSRLRIQDEDVLENSTQSSGDSLSLNPTDGPRSAPPGLQINQPAPRPQFSFPAFNQNLGNNLDNVSAGVRTDTSCILLGMKNRQQALQSNLDAQALRLSNIEKLSVKLDRACREMIDVSKNHSERLEVAEGDIRYVSKLGATAGNQAEQLDQRVVHNSTCIENLTGLVDGCSTFINQSNERYRNLESDLERAKKEIKEVAWKGNGGNSNKPSIYPKVELDIPTFEAEPFEKPARFMDDIWTYMFALNCDEDTMKLAIGQALKGPAREWWYHAENEDCLNEVYQETIEATPLEIHLNKTPTRFWQKWINPPERKDIPYEQKLVWVHERITKKGDRRATALNEKYPITEFQEGEMPMSEARRLKRKARRNLHRARVRARKRLVNRNLNTRAPVPARPEPPVRHHCEVSQESDDDCLVIPNVESWAEFEKLY